MEYKLIKSKRKTISIQINKDAQVIVKAPHSVSQKYIENFILSKKGWIEKNVEKMKETAVLRQPKKFIGGEIFMLFGKEYMLCVSSVDSKIKIMDDRIFFPSKFMDNPKDHMVKFYKKIAKKYLTERALKIAKQLNLQPNSIKITSADKRWGSCSSKKNINFSYKLIMADEIAIDYVIIHELCHLLYMNHSSSFWNAVHSIMPNYKTCKNYLKQNEHRFII
ncbi:MAG: SprT family zinc-dependent metalloprotease [Eubacteriales bacterium]